MGHLLTKGATGTCSHGGNATPIAGNPRVQIAGNPVLTMASQLSIAGCPNNPSGVSPLPCVIAMFTSCATRVTVNKVPVLLKSSSTTNLPTGASTTITEPQTRVKGL
jgi:hypothetical protein